MKKIYSKLDNTKCIHIFFSLNDFEARKDIVDENHFLQVASLILAKNKTFQPHKHIWKKNNYSRSIAQESWVVIKGSVRVYYYDIDGTFIDDEVLNAGDCTITLEGGHNYESLEENTFVYEFKTGPYEGQINDKEFI